ncbi:hypothetical protein AJ78_08670 [Emergomyces pasteurianus Ep9510]|uniref:Uncharacterized protein n=1 Tax=Emergomyces pasteurianus Ep9510 TaxID=1447872 RepID=A0A1J9P1M6_9EURO|nr:hypothetical protein AJ78_08670 [Emergomyces pasteurianus Ep9510]
MKEPSTVPAPSLKHLKRTPKKKSVQSLLFSPLFALANDEDLESFEDVRNTSFTTPRSRRRPRPGKPILKPTPPTKKTAPPDKKTNTKTPVKKTPPVKTSALCRSARK